MKITTQEFIRRAKLVHGDKYDYSKSIYLNSSAKICIICPKHGEFFQLPHHHTAAGQNCSKCKLEFRIKALKSNTNEFISKAKKVHGDKYNYSKVDYVNAYTKVLIGCPIHGNFLQKPNAHLTGNICTYCVKNFKLTYDKFVEKANAVHYNRYDYSKTNYVNVRTKINIGCPVHGIFIQKPNAHLNGDGCPKCQSSKGELKISDFLDKHQIDFVHQKTFDDCRNPKTNTKLKFDIYVPSKNLLIEYDGEQHFRSNCVVRGQYVTSKNDLKETKFRDKVKTKYAKKNNINLLRIKYTELNKIETTLSSYLL